MRYDKEVTFVQKTQGEYNRETGNYDKGTEVRETRLVSIVETSVQTMTMVYGGLKQGSLTIHMQNIYPNFFDYIEIDGKRYKVDSSGMLRLKSYYVISEVQK